MLQDMRKSAQGTVAKVVVGFIIVIFALFGAESIVGSLGGEPEVASVNGEGITESNFTRALEGKRRQILSQMGERVDPDATVVVVLAPARLDPLGALHAVEGGVERAFLDAQRVVGDLADNPADRVAVQRPPVQYTEHEKIERPAQRI